MIFSTTPKSKMTDLTPKFSPNPYTNLDPDVGDESSLFNTLKIFAPAVQ
jgi:hypothetical protein